MAKTFTGYTTRCFLYTFAALLTGMPGLPVTGKATGPIAAQQTVYAAEGLSDGWKAEFEDICSKTSDPMSLSRDELKHLVLRCDTLKPRIETLDDTEKRVYLRKLKLCRDLYYFVLESKENGDGSQQPHK